MMNLNKRMSAETYGPDEDAAAAAEATRAIEYIEANLFDALTVQRIASNCAASHFHFSRRFSRRQGESVMAYVRGRRLEVAARRLIDEPGTSVVEIALDCRFDSHSAFTRAFTRSFGVSPRVYRDVGDVRVRKRRSAMTPPPQLRESIERLETFHVAGLTGRYDPTNYVRIAELWQAFVPKAQFTGRLGEGETCGVFRNRDLSLHSFEHLAGARIEPDLQPERLEVWTLPTREYLVFKHMLVDGDLHPQVAAAQAEIWGHRIPQSGRRLASAPDFQIYPANFKVGAGGWLAYYLPLE
jgi:AraC family transcriptional regulator